MGLAATLWEPMWPCSVSEPNPKLCREYLQRTDGATVDTEITSYGQRLKVSSQVAQQSMTFHSFVVQPMEGGRFLDAVISQ